MINFPLLIFVFIVFALIIVSYSMKDVDFVAISLICMFIAAFVTGLVLEVPLNFESWFDNFVLSIEWQAIIIILSMSIISKIAQDSNVLEYLAVKIFKISKGNQRYFFYLICIITTLLAAVISDVVVVIILAPVVVRLCHFLKIRAGTYLLGMTICINIGSIITPFSSGENIIISTWFALDTPFFIQYFWLFSFALLFLTIFLIDKLMLSKEPKIKEEQREYVIELISTDVMIKNKKMFYFNSIAILVTITLFVVLPLLYLTAAISAVILVLVNRKYTKKPMGKILKDVEWEIIFFFISMYVVINCMLQAGFRDIIGLIPFESFGSILTVFIILILVSLLSGFIANTPVALIFIPIIEVLIEDFTFPVIPLLFAFIVAVNLGGNLLPSGAAADMMTLKVAKDSGVENLGFKRLLKTGAAFSLIHIASAMGFLFILILFS
jgi:Na+/H+ antiporter NhaD/arsenite permease-like protein